MWLALAVSLPACDRKPDPRKTEVCPATDPSGCFKLGVRRMDALPQVAASAFTRACEGGVAAACNNLGTLYEEGRGVAQDTARAATLYQQSCNGDSPHGCASLAALFDRPGAAHDEVKAMSLRDRACALGHLQACDAVALALANGRLIKADKKRAILLWGQACKGGVQRSCASLGINLIVGGPHVERDPKRGEGLLINACNAGHAAACKDLGGMHLGGALPDSDQQRGAKLLVNACNLGNAEGCSALGVAHVQGLGVEKSMSEAAKLFERACDGGAMTGCFNLAVALANGDGVERDSKRAGELLRKGCEGGHEDSCAALQAKK